MYSILKPIHKKIECKTNQPFFIPSILPVELLLLLQLRIYERISEITSVNVIF